MRDSTCFFFSDAIMNVNDEYHNMKTTKIKLAGSERNTQKVTKNAARVAKSSPRAILRIPFCMYPFPPAPYAGTYKIF